MTIRELIQELILNYNLDDPIYWGKVSESGELKYISEIAIVERKNKNCIVSKDTLELSE